MRNMLMRCCNLSPPYLLGPPSAPLFCSQIFLKEVAKSGVHRFTVRTSERELKLRATNAGDYQAWINALRPFASSFEEDDEMSVRAEPSFGGDGDDDDSD